jgi:hypothetical protein
MSEPWLDRKALAQHFDCSVRSIELRMAEGMPCWRVMGRIKFRISEVEPWLVEREHIERATVAVGSTQAAPADNRGLTTGR